MLLQAGFIDKIFMHLFDRGAQLSVYIETPTAKAASPPPGGVRVGFLND